MTVLNGLDRFHLVSDALNYLQRADADANALRVLMEEKLAEHHRHIRREGEDMREIREWRGPQ